MKLSKKILFAQEGAPMPAPEEGAPMGPEGAPAPEGGAPAGPESPQGGDVEGQVMGMAQELAQQIGDPQIVMMLGQALIQIAQGAGGPEGSAPAEAPAYQREGGRLVRVRR